MSVRVTALKIGIVFMPLAVTFNDLILGVVPVKGDSFGMKDLEPCYWDKSYILVNKWSSKKMKRK